MQSNPEKLRYQPLTMVLAEFQYSDVLKIKQHIPDIQEHIRKKYPILGHIEQKTVQVAGAEVSVETSSQWSFLSHDQLSAVVIGKDRMVFMTSDYDRFPAFSEQCLYLLECVKDLVDPSLLTRIGLRYNDHIDIVIDKIAEIVDPQMLPNEKLTSQGKSTISHKEETVIETSEGVLSLRSSLGFHSSVVMPDLAALPIKVAKTATPEALSLLLDFDHVWSAEDRGVQFDLDIAKLHLNGLHSIARQAFWDVTTDYAKDNLWS
jgi:uncharacterized protein (TIGR04255 family)